MKALENFAENPYVHLITWGLNERSTHYLVHILHASDLPRWIREERPAYGKVLRIVSGGVENLKAADKIVIYHDREQFVQDACVLTRLAAAVPNNHQKTATFVMGTQGNGYFMYADAHRCEVMCNNGWLLKEERIASPLSNLQAVICFLTHDGNPYGVGHVG